MCCPLSTIRSRSSTRRARPPNCGAASKTVTARPAAASVTAAASPDQPAPMTAMRSFVTQPRRTLVRPRGLPGEPGFRERRERDALVEDAIAVALDLVEQAPVDRCHDEPWTLRAPIAPRQLSQRLCVPDAGARHLVRHQRSESGRDAALEHVSGRHAEALELVLRKIDAAAARIFANVADDVGELKGDAEVARIVAGCWIAVAEDFRREEADHARDVVAIAL